MNNTKIELVEYDILSEDPYPPYSEPILRYNRDRVQEIRMLVKDLRLEYRRMTDGLAEYFLGIDDGTIDTNLSYNEWFSQFE